MEIDQNNIMSSEGTEPETISNNTIEINEPTTSISENECRINCTNQQSLRNILDLTLNHIEELAAATCNEIGSRSEFVTLFSESFKNALEENILVNGLPLMIDESNKLSSLEKQDHSHMVDDVLFGKLSKKVAGVAHKRKFYPEQCCRVLNIEMKHELQNLKKAKVVDSSLPLPSLSNPSNTDRTIKKFSEFCQGFSTMQETVQCKLQEREKLSMKLDQIKEIQKNEKKCSSVSSKSTSLQ